MKLSVFSSIIQVAKPSKYSAASSQPFLPQTLCDRVSFGHSFLLGRCLSVPHAHLSSHPAFQGSGSPRLCPRGLCSHHTVSWGILIYPQSSRYICISPVTGPDFSLDTSSDANGHLRQLVHNWTLDLSLTGAPAVILTVPFSHPQDQMQHQTVPHLSVSPAQGFLGLFLQWSEEACGYLLGIMS